MLVEELLKIAKKPKELRADIKNLLKNTFLILSFYLLLLLLVVQDISLHNCSHYLIKYYIQQLVFEYSESGV